MLRKRIMTACVLIPLVIAGILYLSDRWFAVASGGLMLLGGWEWSRLMKENHWFPRVLFLMALTMLALLSWYLSPLATLLLATVWWVVATIWVAVYPKGSQCWQTSSVLRLGIGLLVLLPFWVGINYVRLFDQGPRYLFLLLFLVWGADTGAYFVGRRWGKTPLVSAVSPKKTREGLFGGVLVALLIAVIMVFAQDLEVTQLPGLSVLLVLTVLFSVVGDLLESVIKRLEGVKDSGRLLPGHGGILDRIDSLTAAAPVFALGLLLLGIQ